MNKSVLLITGASTGADSAAAVAFAKKDARMTRFTGTQENKAAPVTGAPMGRVGTSEEPANAIVFIASDAASFITGHILNVAGGHSAN